VKASSGELIAFLDDDDEWLPNKLIRQISLFEKSSRDVGVVHSNCFINDGLRIILRDKKPITEQSTRKLLEFNFIATSTVVVKKSVFDTIGYFDEQIPYAEDWEFFIRVSKKFKFMYLPEPMAILNKKAEKRLSGDLQKVVKGFQLIISKHWQEYKKHKQALSRHLQYISSNMNYLKDRTLTQWFLSKALSVFPRHPKPLMLFCLHSIPNLNMIKLRIPKTLQNLVNKFLANS
jgi:glycosyltransferase involved in cell wall biosynthesis